MAVETGVVTVELTNFGTEKPLSVAFRISSKPLAITSHQYSIPLTDHFSFAMVMSQRLHDYAVEKGLSPTKGSQHIRDCPLRQTSSPEDVSGLSLGLRNLQATLQRNGIDPSVVAKGNKGEFKVYMPGDLYFETLILAEHEASLEGSLIPQSAHCTEDLGDIRVYQTPEEIAAAVRDGTESLHEETQERILAEMQGVLDYLEPKAKATIDRVAAYLPVAALA